MIADALFLFFAGVTLVGALLAVTLPKVFYNALSLILCLAGVAAMFLFLDAEFLAVMEVIIYIGAIAIAILFAIMLSQPMQAAKEPRSRAKTIRAAVAAGLLFLGLSRAIGRAQWPIAVPDGDYSIGALGRALLSTNMVAFEAVSLVLLVAIIGALVLTGTKGRG